MKNQLVIILDTESEIPLQIGKMQDEKPTDPEEMKAIMALDFSTLSEAILVLIKELHDKRVQPSGQSIQQLIEAIDQEFPGTFTITE